MLGLAGMFRRGHQMMKGRGPTQGASTHGRRRRRRRIGPILATLASCGLIASACAANFKNDTFRDGPVAFRVPQVPATWRRIKVEGESLAFRDSREEATISINGECGKSAPDVPLEALVHHLFLQFTDRQLLSQERFMLDGRGALRTELRASLDGVPMHFVAIVMKKNGCVYDFVNINPTPLTATGKQSISEFDRFVAGFRTLPAESS